MKILLPDSLPFDLDLPGGVQTVSYRAAEAVPAEHADAEVWVLWNSPADAIRDSVRRLRSLRLVQALPAGPDFLRDAGFADDVALCNGVGLHGPMVAEHALALTLALVRRLPELARSQAAHTWRRDLGGAQPLRPESGPVTSLHDANVVVWGFGDLGQHYARAASVLGATVTGIARSAGERGGFPVTDDPAAVLGDADIIVLCLPSAERPALDAATIATLRPGVLVINVGRGSAIDEDALVEGLRRGTIGGAGLDVFREEPLAASSPLWDEPQVIITPHAAGGRPLGYDALISRNVRHLIAGEPLENLIER